MNYELAWTIHAIASLVVIIGVTYYLRRHFFLGLLVFLMGCYWTLMPYDFDGEHSAPLFIVVVFRVFLEHDANIAGPLTSATLGSVGILILALIVVALRYLFRIVRTRYRLTKRLNLRLKSLFSTKSIARN